MDTVYPLLSNYYTNSANPNLDSLTSVQLAEVQVLQNVSTNTFGNISVDALALRMAYTQATNYASEGPPDPREDVQDMICEAATSAADTGAMIVAVQSACSIQKCNKGSSGCSSKNTKRDLHDGPRDLTDFNILKRYFDQVGLRCLTFARLPCLDSSIVGLENCERRLIDPSPPDAVHRYQRRHCGDAYTT